MHLFIRQFEEGYFLTDPSLFITNHYPLDAKWALLDQPPSLEEFVNAPLVYRGAFRYGVVPLCPERFNIEASKGKSIGFRFRRTDGDAIEKVELRIDSSVAAKNVSLLPDGNAPEQYYLNYAFPARGNHTVHIVFNDQYAFTYRVKVRGE